MTSAREQAGALQDAQIGAPAGFEKLPGVAGYFARIVREVVSDWPLYAVIAVYVSAGGALAFSLSQQAKFHPFLYVDAWLWTGLSWLLVLLSPLAALAVVDAIRRNPAAPFSELLKGVKRACGPRLIAGIALIAAVAIFYGTFTSIKNMFRDMAPFSWDVPLADLDRFLHGGFDPATVVVPPLSEQAVHLLEFIYDPLWLLLSLGLTTFVAVSAKYAHLRQRFFLTYFLCWFLIGNVLAILFLSGGPCFYGQLTGDYARFAELNASLEPTLTGMAHRYLWHLFEIDRVDLATGISAFPSMHLSVATLVAILLWKLDRRLGWGGIVFVALVQLGSVRLGFHYAIDGYAAIALTLLLWKAAGPISSQPKGVSVVSPKFNRKGSEN